MEARLSDGADRGDPDFTVGALSLWTKGRTIPDPEYGWDAAWITVNALIEKTFARVELRGAGLTSMDFAAFLPQLEALARTLEGEAVLQGMEPWLKLRLHGLSLGHLAVEIDITPDDLNQRHWFKFEIDQTYLPAMIRQVGDILARFPVPDLRSPD